VGEAVGEAVVTMTDETGADVTAAERPAGAETPAVWIYWSSRAVVNEVAFAMDALMLCVTFRTEVVDRPVTLKETSKASAALASNRRPVEPTDPIDVRTILLGSTPRKAASAALKIC
jgi:hypothetical protein